MNPHFNKGVSSLKKAGEQLTASIQEAAELINKYTFDKLEDLQDQILEAEQRISDLTAQYSEKNRVAQLDFELAQKRSKQDACKEYATDLGCRFISNKAYSELVSASMEVDKKIKAAEERIADIMSSQNKAALKEANMQHQLDTANVQAQLANLQTQNEFLSNQLRDVREQLATANENAVRIAEAKSSVVNVSDK